MFNQFSVFNAGAFYSTYVVWNGKNSDFCKDLRSNTVYRVNHVDMDWSRTELRIQEVETGRCLDYGYNSTLFTPLKGYIGKMIGRPFVGYNNHISIEGQNLDVAVIGIERISNSVWNLISTDAIYTVQVE